MRLLALRTAAIVAVVVQVGVATARESAPQAVVGERFAVTSGHPDATAAGMAVLRAGGNVVDAAVATSLALGVAEPYGSGIGGKAMLLYRDAKSGQVVAIEAMGEASEALDASEFAARPRRERYYGYTAVAVPGLVAALDEAHERWGSMKWRDVVMPAAELAERGVVVSAKMYRLMRPKRNLLRRDAQAARMFLDDGETPAVGSVMKYPQLAQTLRTIADEGRDAFYEGPIAKRIVQALNDAGAPMTLADFASYRARVGEPLAVDYEAYRVYSAPPPLTGGTTVLAALRGLDSVAALEASDGRDPRYIDLVGRLLLAIYPRITATIADVPGARDDANRLFGEESVQTIQREAAAVEPANVGAKPAQTSMHEATADDYSEASTTHLIVADAEGNIVCLTQSLSYHFGACVVAPETGVLLNDSMSNFATRDPDGCNYVAPGKRERSTIAPVIVTKEGRAALALGIPGGQRIPTTTIQLLTDVLHFRCSLAEAFDRARFHVRRPIGADESANMVDLEEDAPAGLDDALVAMGWKPVRHTRDGSYFGGGSAIGYKPDGIIEAVADKRRTNTADAD